MKAEHPSTHGNKSMDANAVLAEHHAVLKGLTDQIDDAATGSPAHRQLIDRLLLELDCHMQIEDRLYYPAVRTVSPLVAVAHAEHREVSDRLAAALRIPVTGKDFPVEWQAFTETLHHHAAEEERDMFPHAQNLGADALAELGAAMTTMLEQRRRSRLTQCRVRIKGALLRRV